MISQRIQSIQSFLAMEMAARAQALKQSGRSVISLALGEPDLLPPTKIKESCLKALKDDFVCYTPTEGLAELRQSVARSTFHRYGVKIQADQVLITAGSSPAFLLVLLTLLNPGDGVVLPEICYPCYPNFVKAASGTVQYAAVTAQENFHYDFAKLTTKITPQTRAIFVSSPSNPTGSIISENLFKKLASLNFYLISDEVYHGLSYEAPEQSALQFSDKVFVINSFSKAYCMTGYRLGYVICPKPFIEPLRKLHQSLAISANSFVQKAGIAALETCQEEQKVLKNIFFKRRAVALETLNTHRLKPAVVPQGAFYLWLDVSSYTQDSKSFAIKLLEHTGVAVTPGIDFGPAGEGFIRLSYANSEENIREGIHRLGDFLSNSPVMSRA